MKTEKEIIEKPLDTRPHLVLLGAGASRAAFPNGEANGKRLPVMDDMINTIKLQDLISKIDIGMEDEINFEVIYSNLASEPVYEVIAKEIECRIYEYFHKMILPDKVTIYDRILLSLQPRDVVFTFNWDPFLFDAYKRNQHIVSLPQIFFLHGNVRIAACLKCFKWGEKNILCSECGQGFTDIPLLYPIRHKSYSTNPFINEVWEAAKFLFKDAFTLTIFGYSAPDSDVDAVELLKLAWFGRGDRTYEHIEIIDIAEKSHLYKKWLPFAPTNHLRIHKNFNQSRISRWPRRTCESLFYPMFYGIPCEDFPLPVTESLDEIQNYVSFIAEYEDSKSKFIS